MRCECVSVRKAVGAREIVRGRSRCGEKLNDPSATLCIFASGGRPQTDTRQLKADCTVSRRSIKTVNMHSLRG